MARKLLHEGPDRAESHQQLEHHLKKHPRAECAEDLGAGIFQVWSEPAPPPVAPEPLTRVSVVYNLATHEVAIEGEAETLLEVLEAARRVARRKLLGAAADAPQPPDPELVAAIAAALAAKKD